MTGYYREFGNICTEFFQLCFAEYVKVYHPTIYLWKILWGEKFKLQLEVSVFSINLITFLSGKLLFELVEYEYTVDPR